MWVICQSDILQVMRVGGMQDQLIGRYVQLYVVGHPPGWRITKQEVIQIADQQPTLDTNPTIADFFCSIKCYLIIQSLQSTPTGPVIYLGFFSKLGDEIFVTKLHYHLIARYLINQER